MTPARNLLSTSFAIFTFCQIGTISSKRKLDKYYRELYAEYKDEVLLPQYRGLKLYNGKTLNQLDDPKHSNGNFEDLKELLNKNKR